jgi:ribosomal protein S18 acetylase RimI-like enzyme
MAESSEPVMTPVMTMHHYDAVHALMATMPGITIRTADSREATIRYLTRNPDLSFVALMGDRIVGCIMCGHDGRRGYLHHLAVDSNFRRQGIGTALVTRCLDALQELGIEKTHIDVLMDNAIANDYWASAGWTRREDLVRYSFTRSKDPNA